MYNINIMTKRSLGFTIIELILIIAVTSAASIIFFVQKDNIQSVADDNIKKTAINSMYYGLEEVFYPTNGYYPQSISSDVLKSVDPDLFTDPSGIVFGETGNSYSYTPTECSDNQCKGYTLKATLKNEADYTKSNRN